MAYTAARTWVAGETVTAALLNAHIRDNTLACTVAVSTGVGDLVYASAANTLARIAVGTTGQILMVNPANTPSWQAGLPASGYFMGANGANYHVESGNATCSSGTVTVTFGNAYGSAPQVVIGPKSQNYYSVTTISATEFTVTSDNASGSFSWLSEGAD